jgi:heme-degrading monooxygenase HmoA
LESLLIWLVVGLVAGWLASLVMGGGFGLAWPGMVGSMLVRVGSFLVQSGQSANLRTTYNEQAVPKVRTQAGNLGCLLLEPDAEGEPFLVITLWEDRAAAEKYEASGAAAEVVSLVRRFFAGPPTLRSYESASVAGLPLRPVPAGAP